MGKKAEIPPELFCDAGFLIALFAKSDSFHEKALKIYRRLKGNSVRLATPWTAVSEAGTLLLYHYGYSTALALFNALESFHLIVPTEDEYQRALDHFRRFNRDQKFSLNDLLAYTLLQGRLKSMPVLTFDKDFSKMGLTVFG